MHDTLYYNNDGGDWFMLDVKIKDLLNQQINKEFYSAYLYLAFSNYFSERNLSGFSNWYRIQAQEERDHAMLFLQYLENNSDGCAGGCGPSGTGLPE